MYRLLENSLAGAARNHVDGMIGRYQTIARHAAPGRQIDGRARVAGDDLEPVAFAELAHAALELDYELPAAGLTGIPSFRQDFDSRPFRAGSVEPHVYGSPIAPDSLDIQAMARLRVKAAASKPVSFRVLHDAAAALHDVRSALCLIDLNEV